MSKRELWVVEYKKKRAKTWFSSVNMVFSSEVSAEDKAYGMRSAFPRVEYRVVLYGPKGEK